MSVQPNLSLRDLAPGIFMTQAGPPPTLWQKARAALALWGQRTRTRRFLAQVDARSLAEAGISPAAAAFEAGRPFWRAMGGLR